jgi:Fis family transcriptional regulator
MTKKQIDACVRESLEQYFKDLRGAEPHSLHDMLIATVEKPLLDVVMKQADGNQSKAAEWLGLNRNTLRRKLVDHKLLK